MSRQIKGNSLSKVKQRYEKIKKKTHLQTSIYILMSITLFNRLFKSHRKHYLQISTFKVIKLFYKAVQITKQKNSLKYDIKLNAY